MDLSCHLVALLGPKIKSDFCSLRKHKVRALNDRDVVEIRDKKNR